MDLPRSFTIRESGHRIITGTGADISTVFVAKAIARAAELGVPDKEGDVRPDDATGHAADTPVDVARAWARRGSEAVSRARSRCCAEACALVVYCWSANRSGAANRRTKPRWRAAQWLDIR